MTLLSHFEGKKSKSKKKNKNSKTTDHDFGYLEKLVKENNLMEFQEALEEIQYTLLRSKPMNERYAKRVVDLVLEQRFSKKKRNLFLVAGKNGQRDILFFLLKFGFSIASQDDEGDNIGHLVLSYAGKKGTNFLTVEPDLLYWRNKHGLSVLDYLELAWKTASEEDQKEADRILVLGLERNITQKFVSHDTKKRSSNHGEANWVEKMMYAAEDDFLENFYTIDDDQFYESYAEEKPNQNLHYLDSIRNEYERKRRQEYEKNLLRTPTKKPRESRPIPPPFTKLFSTADEVSSSKFVPNEIIVNIKLHQNKWKEFVNQKNISIQNVSDIPWPQFYDKSAEEISKSINDFTYHLFRQIQVDFHPDRFKLNFFDKIDISKNSGLQACIESKLNSTSQIINQAMSTYKDRKKNQ